MATYEYSCATCGPVDVAKPMRRASEPETCGACGAALRRVYSAPNMIIRPHGYSLRPGEPGYWDIGRALEVGHVPEPDQHSHLGAGAPRPEDVPDDTPEVTLDAAAERTLAEAATATYGEPGDPEAQRVWREALQNGYGREDTAA